MQNAMSWDGVNLGAQWKVWGMAIEPIGPQIVGQSMSGGNGWIAYSTNYLGGQFWLSKLHAWADGVNDLTGLVYNYNVHARVTTSGEFPCRSIRPPTLPVGAEEWTWGAIKSLYE